MTEEPTQEQLRELLKESGIDSRGKINVKGKVVDGDQHKTIVLTDQQSADFKVLVETYGGDDQLTLQKILESGVYPDEIILKDFVKGRVKIGDVVYRIDDDTIDNDTNFRYKKIKT